MLLQGRSPSAYEPPRDDPKKIPRGRTVVHLEIWGILWWNNSLRTWKCPSKFRWFTHQQWWFPWTFLCVYRRVNIMFYFLETQNSIFFWGFLVCSWTPSIFAWLNPLQKLGISGISCPVQPIGFGHQMWSWPARLRTSFRNDGWLLMTCVSIRMISYNICVLVDTQVIQKCPTRFQFDYFLGVNLLSKTNDAWGRTRWLTTIYLVEGILGIIPQNFC